MKTTQSYERVALHWAQHHLDQLRQAQSFRDLGSVAFSVLEQMPRPTGLVSGPISSGGRGSIDANLEVLSQTIALLVGQGRHILTVLPAQDHIFRVARVEPHQWNSALNQQLLDELFLPLLESSWLQTLYMIPGWETSHGASWEHEQAVQRGIERVYLSDDLTFDAS